MSQTKVAALGFLIVIGLVLTLVSFFTPAWVIDSGTIGAFSGNEGFGVIPYRSELPFYFCAACISMYVAIGLTALVVPAYLFASFKARRCGCSHSLRTAFHSVSGFSSLIGFCECFAFFIVLFNAPTSVNDWYGNVKQSLGYSSYLAIVSGFTMSVAAGLAGNIARRDCH